MKSRIFTCPVCGMVYEKELSEDEISHKRFHDRYINGVYAPRVSKKEMIVESGHNIIFVSQNSNKKSIELVNKSITRAECDLGTAPPLPEKWKCYLAYESSSIIGFCVIENTVDAFLEKDPNRKVSCPIGVLRFWVSPKHRRKGIATIMVDAARHNEKNEIPKCMVAFSDPTVQGMLFAKKYCGNDPFIYYLTL